MDLYDEDTVIGLLMSYTGEYHKFFKQVPNKMIETKGAKPGLSLSLKFEPIMDRTIDRGNFIFVELWRGCRLWTRIPLVEPDGVTIMETWIRRQLRPEDKIQYVRLNPHTQIVDITSEMLDELDSTNLVIVKW